MTSSADIHALKEQIIGLRALVDERFDSQKDALARAEAGTEKRFDSVNEFRALLATQQSTYITKVEMEARFKAISDKVDILYQLQLEQKGRLGIQSLVWMYFMGAVGIIGTIIGAGSTLYGHR